MRMIAMNDAPQTLGDLDGFDDWVAEVMAALAGAAVSEAGTAKRRPPRSAPFRADARPPESEAA
jgi:hypothetical protein